VNTCCVVLSSQRFLNFNCHRHPVDTAALVASSEMTNTYLAERGRSHPLLSSSDAVFPIQLYTISQFILRGIFCFGLRIASLNFSQ
jgi:hypothetical protein